VKHYQVGVTKGYRQEAVYKETGIPVQVVPEEYLNFVKMMAGRIDVYETSRTVGFSTIKDLFSSEDAAKFTYHPKAVQQAKYYILFSKKSENGERMSKAFSAGFEKLQTSGRYMEILTEFIGPQNRQASHSDPCSAATGRHLSSMTEYYSSDVQGNGDQQ